MIRAIDNTCIHARNVWNQPRYALLLSCICGYLDQGLVEYLPTNSRRTGQEKLCFSKLLLGAVAGHAGRNSSKNMQLNTLDA